MAKKKYDLKYGAIRARIIGKCVGDGPGVNYFVPIDYSNKPEEIRAWAVQEMK